MSEDTPNQDTPKRGLADRLYARFGWKIWPGLAAAFWAFGLFLAEITTVNLVRIEPVSVGVTVGLCISMAIVLMIAGIINAVVATRFCAPLRGSLMSQEQLAAAWRTAIALPLQLGRVGSAIVMLWVTPTLGLAFALAYGWRPPALIYVTFGIVLITAVTVSALIYAAAVLVRPVLTELQHRLDAIPSSQTITLRTRLIILIPTLSVGATMTGAALAQPTGSGITTATIVVIVGTAVFALFMWTPVAVMFAHSLLSPLADLQAATQRIGKGDYSQPVPEVWADELGAVANSLNDAMKGLSERQQMAREVRESRARIVAAADASRKRIERNIHDGAQQRLVAMALDVRILQQTASTMSPDELDAALEQFAESLKESLAELRDLARGLHPAILSTDGLAPALQQLATRAKVPISVTSPPDRFPEQIETTAYFVAAEALANVAKYAHASHATVTAAQENGHLSIEIADDGVGGASASSGSGLAGLADRVAAIGGKLTVDSEYGKGTRIIADLPLNGWRSNG
ncbi:MAG: histidine kinase [Nocardiaceae bacterium]|nr:histidine kinase [Nocardiaceae bacterium]